MKNKLLRLNKHAKICILVSVCSVLLLAAASQTVKAAYQDGYYYTVTSEQATITNYNIDGSPLDLVIPSSLGGYPVVAIGNSAFYGCTSLTSITIPDGVTSIGDSAFSQCISLISVTIPDGVTSIGASAFYNCIDLASITIPDSVTSIGASAFSHCISLTSVTIPTGVTTIGASAFSQCSSLNSITLPNTITSIGDSAFSWCSSLISVTIPDGVTTIGASAFYYCTSLTSVTIPDSVTSIGGYTFYDCSSLTSVTIPDGVASIGDSTFYWCDSLTSVTIPDSVTSIGDSAFAHCRYLTSVTIPDGVASIGLNTFYECSSLTSITIPDSVTSIGNGAFSMCRGLTSVAIPPGVTSVGSQGFFYCSSLNSITLPNTITSIGDYAFYGCTSLTSITVPDSVTSIGTYAFQGCSSLNSLTFLGLTQPSTGTGWIDSTSSTLLGHAYYGSSFPAPGGSFNGLTMGAYIPEDYYYTITDGQATITGYFGAGGDVTVPDTLGGCTVVAIDNDAFDGCSSLTSITIPSGVASIGDHAFASCSSLTDITFLGLTPPTTGTGWIDNTPSELVGHAYYGSSFPAPDELFNGELLMGAYIPEDYDYTIADGQAIITDIHDGVGGDITIPDTLGGCPVVAIGDSAFFRCSSLISVTIPESVTSIGDSAFSYCTLRSITIGSGVTSIGYRAFYRSALTSVTIPSGVANIGASAFSGCPSLASVTISDGVDSIGDSAFYYCSSLTSITLPNTITSISDSTFYNCWALTSVTIPESVTSIGDSAFFQCSALTSVTIPGSVTSIGDAAFVFCHSLESVAISNGVTSIGINAFYGCSSLTSVTIPASVASIGDVAFMGCSSLAEIIVDEANSNFMSVDGVLFDETGTTLLVYPAGKSGTSYTISTDVTTIGSCAFGECTALTSVTIPSSVTILGDGAFYECSSLTSITIPESVASIGEYAFEECSALISVAIPSGVTSVGSYTFAWCESLISVTMPDSITSIGDYAFTGCTSLTSVTIPSGVVSIGDHAFYSCFSLVDITFLGLTPPVVDLTYGSWIDETNPALVGHAYYGSTFPAPGDLFNGLTMGAYIPEDYYYTITDGQATITGYYGAGGDVTVPDTLGGCPVVAIGYRAFYYCSSLKSVTIPASVTSIGDYAFYYCSSLASVTIPDSVTSIGDAAFYYCDSLTSVTIPESVTSIGDAAFYHCDSLTSVTIPDSVTSIGNRAFYYCSLTSVTIPDSVTSIGDRAFYNGLSLTAINVDEANSNFMSVDGVLFNKAGTTLLVYPAGKSGTSYAIPTGVTSIGTYAFYACYSLTSVTMPSSVTIIGDYAFYYCRYLTSLTLSENVVSIGSWAFAQCDSLENLVIPNGVTSISYRAFSWCYSLESLVIPEGVTSIGQEAFWYCENLTSITIPSSVTTIGISAFQYCHHLTSITFLGLTPPTTGANWILYTTGGPLGHAYYGSGFPARGSLFNGLLMGDYIPIPEDYDYTVADGQATVTGYHGAGGDVTMPDTLGGCPVTAIGNSAFSEYSSLTSIIIPSVVTTIDDYAFAWCSSLSSVTMPNSVTSIGDNAFEGCFSLSSVTIPSSVTSVGDYVFSYCSSLTSVTMPNSVTSIGVSAFSGCSSLTSVTIPNSVTTIGSKAFYWCTSLTSITVPSSVTSIGGYTFEGCSSLAAITVDGDNPNFMSIDGVLFNKAGTTLIQYPAGKSGTSYTIPTGVATIDAYSFAECSSLASVTIPSSVTSIGTYAFAWCSSLNDITIPASVTTIGNSAFQMCSSLTSITVPASITSISANTFYACLALRSVTIPDSVTSIGSDAFYACSSLTSITIPDSVTSIGGYAFAQSGLTSITLPDSVTIISESTFRQCSSLTSIIIPDSVTSIGNGAFAYCTHLTSITFLGLTPPTINTVYTSWIYNTPSALLGHAFSASNFPPPGSYFNGLKMGTNIFTLSVDSAYGSPTPASGWFNSATVITESVTSPIAGPDGTQYVCTGWTGTGSIPSSGTGTSVTFTITADSSITWNWKTQYQVTFSVSPASDGTTDPTGTNVWVDAGTLSISATPNTGYNFDHWSTIDSISFTSSTTASTTATISGSGTITAYFIDNIKPTSSADSLPTCETTSTFNLPYTASDQGSGVKNVQLWYRVGGSGDYTLYGTYTSNTISFTASSNGFYEFYTIATDNADNVENALGTADASTTVDLTDPSVSITTPASSGLWFTSSSVDFAGSATAGGSSLTTVEYQVDGTSGSWTSASGLTSWSFTASSLTEGAHTVYVKTTAASDRSYMTSIVVNVDTVAPSGSITSPSDGAIMNSGSFTVSGSASDATSGVQKVEISADGGSYGAVTSGTTSWSYSASGLADGGRTFKIKVTDNAGWTYESSQISVTVDTVAPSTSASVTSGTSGSNGWYTSNVEVTIVPSDTAPSSGIASTSYSTDNSNWIAYTAPISITTEGTTTIYYYSIDNAGNTQTTQQLTLKIDKMDPTLTKDLSGALNNNGWYISNVEVTLNPGDDSSGSGVALTEYNLNDDGWTIYTSAFTISTEGENSLQHRVTDYAGRQYVLTQQTIKIDNSDPEVEITSPSDGAYFNVGKVDVTGTASDGAGVSKVELDVDDGGYSLATDTSSKGDWSTWSFTTDSLSRGTHIITARVTDMGGATETDSIDVIVGATSLTFTSAVWSGKYSDSVTLSAKLIDLATNKPIEGKTITFEIDTTTKLTDDDLTDSSGTAEVTITLDRASGLYTITAAFAGDTSYLGDSDSHIFTINKEDATVEYTGDSGSVTTAGDTITLRLAAIVTQTPDGHDGDLSSATLEFTIESVTPGGFSATVSNVPVNSAGQAAVFIEDVPVDDSYTIEVRIESSNLYWTEDSDPNTIVVLPSDGQGYVAGGGWIPSEDSANGKINFAFVVHYDKRGNLKGSFVAVFKGTDGFNYKIKSTNWNKASLAFGTDNDGNPTATLTVNGVVQKIDRATGLVVYSWGNCKITVDMTDGDYEINQNGRLDSIAITVYDNSYLILHQWGTKPSQIGIGSGNIVVAVASKRKK